MGGVKCVIITLIYTLLTTSTLARGFTIKKWVEYGRSVRLPCHIDKNVDSWSRVWHDGIEATDTILYTETVVSPVVPGSELDIVKLENSTFTLIVTPVSLTDQHYFSCTTKGSNSGDNYRYRIFPYIPPKIIITGLETAVNASETITINCRISQLYPRGNKTLTLIRLQYDGKEYTNSTETKNDNGTYSHSIDFTKNISRKDNKKKVVCEARLVVNSDTNHTLNESDTKTQIINVFFPGSGSTSTASSGLIFGIIGLLCLTLLITIGVVLGIRKCKEKGDAKPSTTKKSSKHSELKSVETPDDNDVQMVSTNNAVPQRHKPMPAQRSFKHKPTQQQANPAPEPIYDVANVRRTEATHNKGEYSNVIDVEPGYAEPHWSPKKPPRLHDTTNNNAENGPQDLVYVDLRHDKKVNNNGIMPRVEVPTEYARIDFTQKRSK